MTPQQAESRVHELCLRHIEISRLHRLVEATRVEIGGRPPKNDLAFDLLFAAVDGVFVRLQNLADLTCAFVEDLKQSAPTIRWGRRKEFRERDRHLRRRNLDWFRQAYERLFPVERARTRGR